MSQSQSASAPPGPLGTVLASLEAEHALVPPDQRGLAPELKALSDRLKADPALENDPRFAVEVAWLVQDWAQHSGTGKPAVLPPLLQAGLQVIAQDVPGLQNPDMKALLAHTPFLADRELAGDIRKRAIALSTLPTAEQNSLEAVKAIAVLDYRSELAPVTRDYQAPPAPANGQPPNQATEATASAPATASAAAQPATGQGDVPSTVLSAVLTGQPATESEGTRSANPGSGNAPIAQPSTSAPANAAATTSILGQAAQNEPPTAAQISATKTAQQASLPQPVGPSALTPPPGRPNPGAQAVADVVAQVVGGTLAPVAGVVQGIGKGLSTHMANHRAQSDRRAIDNHVEKLRLATRYAEADLGALREHGRPFFESFDKAVAQAGGDAQQVIADMAPGRPHEALHQALKDTLGQNPGFSEAWKRLRSSTDALGRQSELLRFEAAQRGMSDDQSVQEGEQAAAKTGWKLANLPGLEAGKTFLREASQMVEALVERFRNFLSRVFGRNEQQDQSPSPSPGQ